MEGKIKAISQKIFSVVVHYPAVLIMSIIMAGSIVYSIELENTSHKSFLPVRFIIASSLGISLMFGVKMLSQRIGKTLLLHALGLLILIGYFLITPSDKEEFTDAYVFIIFPSVLLSHLFVSFAAYSQKESETSFWQYNKNLFVNFFLTSIFTGVLTGGVTLAILAVQELFSIDFDNDIYAETFFMLAIVGSTFIFLLFNEKGLNHLEKDASYPVVLKFFTQFVLIPLLLIYSVILYFYSGKILLHWELPQGWVSYLILAYSILGILALLLVHPLKDNSARSWVRIFSKIFYLALFPLLALLFTAIFTRLLEYGFTEPRYFVLLIAIWLLIVVCYFTFRGKPTIKFIPISLFTIGLLALIFPYFNVFSTSVRSQKHELEMVLKQNDLLKNGKIDFDKNVSTEIAWNVADKISYLSEREQQTYLKKFMDSLAEDADLMNKWHVHNLFTKVAATGDYNAKSLVSKDIFRDIKGYEYAISSDELQYKEVEINGDSFTLKSKGSKFPRFNKLKLNDDQQIDLTPVLKGLYEKHAKATNEEVAGLHTEFKLGKYHVKILFSSIEMNAGKNGKEYGFNDALILLRKTQNAQNN